MRIAVCKCTQFKTRYCNAAVAKGVTGEEWASLTVQCRCGPVWERGCDKDSLPCIGALLVLVVRQDKARQGKARQGKARPDIGGRERPSLPVFSVWIRKRSWGFSV